MPDPVRLLQAAGMAAAIAAAALLLLGLLRKPAALRAAAVLAVALGLAAGCAWLGLWPHWPPREDQDRLLIIVLPAVVAGEFLAAGLAGRWAWLPRLAVAMSAGWVLLYGSTYLEELAGPDSREWSAGQTWLILGGMAVALAAVWAALVALAQRAGGRAVPLAVALACGGAAPTIMLSGYASGGQLGVPLAAALLGALLASLFWRQPLDSTGLTGVALVGLFALVVIGRFFGQLATPHALVLFFAPLLCWLPEVPPMQRGGPRLRALSRLALTAAAVALVVMLAQEKFAAEVARPTPGVPEASLEDYMDFGK